MASSPTFLVGAIDFGTTFSGWSYSFLHEFKSNPTIATVRHWNSGTVITEKTPTCALISPDGKRLEGFGYDAENRYRELAEKNQHRDFYYFRRFKMALNKEAISRELMIEDEMGKSFRAIDVFSLSIAALADDMMKSSGSTVSGRVVKDDVHWVLTVPAIWSDAAKQFMREAATKAPASIKSEKLSIALEPEAASLFCRHLSVDSFKGKNTISQLPIGTKYMILDAGGGTIDITIHEVAQSGGLKEVHAATGGGWGGILVDEAFKNLLIDLLGKEVFEKFAKNETEDWLELWRSFEVKKKTIEPHTKDGKITMTVCQSLRDLCKAERNMEFKEIISSSKYSSQIEATGDKMRIETHLMQELFINSVSTTVDHVKSVLRHENARDVKAILMVGGYSDSSMLQEAIKKEFRHLQIVIPKDASSAIMRGAVIFGHHPASICQRVLRKTYGKKTTRLFDGTKHDAKYKFLGAKGEICGNLFSKLAEKGQTVLVGETTPEKSYHPVDHDQDNITVKFFASDLNTPKYVDDGCVPIGKMRVDLKDVPGDLDRDILVSLTFGDTELKATCRVEKTGQILTAKLDFLG